MTTIVANKKMMAADTMTTAQDGLKTKDTKLFEVNGDIIGTAGDSQDGLAFINWYKDQTQEKPEDLDDFEAMVLTKEGELIYYGDRLLPDIIQDSYYCIGSGSHVAVGAMEHGASPAEAVATACRKTTGSGFPVQIMKLKRKK